VTLLVRDAARVKQPNQSGDLDVRERVVLLHGLASSHRIWERVIPLLGEDCDPLALDLIGGQSVDAEARAVIERLDRPAVVAGHSLGGLVATAVAEARPDLVRGLVLVNSPPTTASRLTANAGLERVMKLPLLGQLLWTRATDNQRRRGASSAVAPGAPVPDVLVEDVRATSHRAFVGSTRAVDAYLHERSLHDRVGALQIPVEVVFGLEDRRVARSSLDGYDGLENVTVTRIPGAGHSPPLEAPKAVADILIAATRR
jgi:pimeloyl-ACP methyl ester carboxylesterase